jgi:hypothetical protein
MELRGALCAVVVSDQTPEGGGPAKLGEIVSRHNKIETLRPVVEISHEALVLKPAVRGSQIGWLGRALATTGRVRAREAAD